MTVHRALQSSCVLACFVHQLLQNAAHFPIGAAAAGSVSVPPTDNSRVSNRVKQRAIFILYSSAAPKPSHCSLKVAQEIAPAGMVECRDSALAVCQKRSGWLGSRATKRLWSQRHPLARSCRLTLGRRGYRCAPPITADFDAGELVLRIGARPADL